MRRSISDKREHPAEPMNPDVSTATGTNYFHLFKYSTSLDAEPGFNLVEHRLLVENE